jgi:hypothetical protein|tara:strand:- start:39 stop:452 length:414 start_codon:yes stop_codon:yes gene_type:complete
MSSVEERKKDRFEKTINALLDANPITGIAKKMATLLKGTLTKEKELNLNKIIDDIKSEIKQGKVEARASAKAGKGISKFEDMIQPNMKPAPMPMQVNDPRDDFPQFTLKRAKGGMVKKKKNKLAGRLAMRGYGIARK